MHALDFFATAAKGTEPALRDELRELRFYQVRADRGGVHFSGTMLDGARACLESRIAIRVMLRLAEGPAPDAEALYELVRSVDWSEWISPRHTLAVSAVARDSGLTHTQFIAQKTKDAIVDRLRDERGARPDVDRDDADVRVFVHLSKDHAALFLDLAGESLHLRGYRTKIGEAPLKETLAAAILRYSGWDRRLPLLDPMCGAGTIAIEAWLWAHDVAPGLARRRFGFERWASHDESLTRAVAAMREAAQARVKPQSGESPRILGSDIDAKAIEAARSNARATSAHIDFRTLPLSAAQPFSPPGFVVTNPPYDERLAADEDFYRDMAAALRGFHKHEVAILAGTPAIEQAMRMRWTSAKQLWNGNIECRLLRYSIP
jgi:putative N6-adenine-specific DNA methylase